MRATIALCALLLTCSLAQAELRISGETKVAANHLVRLEATGDVEGAALLWDVSPDDVADVEELGKRLLFVAPAGSYKVKLRAVRIGKDGKVSAETARVTVAVGEVPPGPGPLPPGPGPVPPTPPVPPVPVPAAPIAAPGFRVLIVEETAERGKLTPGQSAAIFGKTTRDYLRAKCAKDPDNPQGAYRIWDKDIDASSESKPWQEAMKRPRASTPWLIVSNPAIGGYEGPLPDKVEETLSILKKFGGE